MFTNILNNPETNSLNINECSFAVGEIRVLVLKDFYKILNPCVGVSHQHYYPTIVSIELFMKCVEVRKGRNKQFSKIVKQETVFKGLIKYVNCGCTVTPDIKKGKYIYLKPNTKKIDGKKCDCKQINENKANDMVSKVFKSMTISEDVLQGYLQALKTRFDKTNNEETNERLNLAKQLKFLDSRFDRLKKTYLDGDFSREEYLKEKQDIELEQKFLENKIAQLFTDNKEFEITLEYLLELTSKINFLYESSRIERKRKILNLVFSNFFLNGSNLSYELKKPFDLIVKKAYCLLNWEPVDATRTDFDRVHEFLVLLIVIDNDL